MGVKVATVAGIEPTALPAAIEKKAQACAKFSARKGLDAVVTVRRNPTATDIKWALLLAKAIRQAGGSARYEGPASAARAKPAPCEPDYAACISAIGDLPING